MSDSKVYKVILWKISATEVKQDKNNRGKVGFDISWISHEFREKEKMEYLYYFPAYYSEINDSKWSVSER